MNAVHLIREDHRKIRELFELARQSESRAQTWSLYHRIRQELLVHAQIEETVFYPVFHKYEDLQGLVEHSFDEHQEMKDLISQIDKASRDEEISDLLDELIDTVEHHAEQEESRLLSRAEQILEPQRLQQLGAMMLDAKHRHVQAA